MTNYKTVFQLAQDKGYKMRMFELINPEFEAFGNQILIELTLIQKWLRDEHKIDCTPSPAHDTRQERWYFSNCYYVKKGKTVIEPKDFVNKCSRKAETKSYESALLEGIHEALKLIP